MRVLEVEGLNVRYGVVRAVTDVDMHVDEGELVVVVGANGAGKSSLLRSVAGLACQVWALVSISAAKSSVAWRPSGTRAK